MNLLTRNCSDDLITGEVQLRVQRSVMPDCEAITVSSMTRDSL